MIFGDILKLDLMRILYPKKDKEKIRDVIDSFSQYSATDLVSLTHRQSPWKDAYRTGAHSEITKEAIRTYFNNKGG